MSPALTRSKSTSSSSSALSGAVSYQLVASAAPEGASQGGEARGAKKPQAPAPSRDAAPASLVSSRARSPRPSRRPKALPTSDQGWEVTPSQKARSLSPRVSGGLPAMNAALMAPIEIPATQSG